MTPSQIAALIALGLFLLMAPVAVLERKIRNWINGHKLI